MSPTVLVSLLFQLPGTRAGGTGSRIHEWLLAVPKAVGAALTWLGLADRIWRHRIHQATAYPGYLVAIPVVGTALVIAGGNAARGLPNRCKGVHFDGFGALGIPICCTGPSWRLPPTPPAQRLSSLPPERHRPVLALIVSVVSFYLIENPVRHARFSRSGRWTPIGLGVVLIALSLPAAHDGDRHPHGAYVVSTSTERRGARAWAQPSWPRPPTSSKAIRASTTIKKLPYRTSPRPSQTFALPGEVRPGSAGQPSGSQTSIPPCMFGDPSGTRTMVVYGDSHAGMWFQTLNSIAKSIGWRLAYLGKPWCPASSLPYPNPSRKR